MAGWRGPKQLKGKTQCTLLACLALAAVIPTSFSPADEPNNRTVRLVVDFGDGFEKHFTQLRWQDKMTVFDAMQLARQHRRGIRFEYRGKGATLLLTFVGYHAFVYQGAL